MIVYTIRSETAKYKIYHDEKLVASADRKLNFFGDKITFWDPQGKEIIRVKHFYFLIIGFGYKVNFLADGIIKYIRPGWRRLNLDYNNNMYTISYNIFSVNENLYLNGELEGQYKVTKEGLISFEHQISCKSEQSCYIFSVLDIVQHYYETS